MRKALACVFCGVAIWLTPSSAAAQYVEISPVAEALQAARWTGPAFSADSATPGGILQEPGRQTRRGAIIGGIAGAVTGLGIGAFIALFCEVESDDGCLGFVPGLTLVGAAGGAIAGAIIGAAIPRSEPEPERPGEDPGRPEDRAPDRRIGTASIQAVGAFARADDFGPGSLQRVSSQGAGVRLNLFAELRPWLALGPELGQTWFGGELGSIRYVSAAVRGTWRTPTLSPYAIADLGLYQWRGGSREFLGGGIGAGVRYHPDPASRFFLDVGGRWQQNVQNIEHVGAGSVAIGAGTTW